MKIFSLVEPIIQKLSTLPGLDFLQRYVMDFRSRHEQIKGRALRYQGYVTTARGVGSDVGQAARGSKVEETDDDEKDDEDDEDDDDIDDEESYMQ